MSELRLFAAALALVLVSVVGANEGGWIHLGESLEMVETTPIATILADPMAFHDREVRIAGRIASVCTEEGCFMEVVPEAGGGEGIVVNFPGLSHTFPTDCAGLEAIVEGRFYQKVYPRARVSHWQHHSFRPGEAIPEYSLAFRLDVRGATIGGTRTAPPAPAGIREASADLVDLDLMEFEAEGLGIGQRTVAPGEVVPRPSTGGNRWMVVCIDGSVVVHRADREPLALRAPEMTYIPAGVAFDVRNESDVEANLMLVYVRKLETEPTVQHGHASVPTSR
jgi:mannose-6-phosphate isomerase-like protein (cupin superfamily)